MVINSLELSEEEKSNLELIIEKFKKDKINELIDNSYIIGQCSNVLKNNKDIINNNINNLNPVWIRIMTDEIEKILFSMKEIVYQINNFENIINKPIEFYTNINNNNDNDKNIVDTNIVDKNIVDTNIVDTNIVDKNIIDKNITKKYRKIIKERTDYKILLCKTTKNH